MAPMCYLHRFMVIFCFAGLIGGCEKRGRQEDTKQHSKETMDRKMPIVRTLPINDHVIYFNVGNGEVRYPPPDGTAEFFKNVQEVGSSFSKENRIYLKYPYGNFLVSEKLQAIGFSLLPMLTFTDVMPLGLVGWPADSKASLPDVSWSFHDMPALEWNCHKISIRSVESLSKIKELEFIDFDYAGFEEGIWQSIAKLASTGSLIGLSMVRGGDFLEKRGNIIIPEIRGLAVHVETVEQVAAFGQAFPNLSYVSLSMDGTNLIGDMMERNTLNSAFPHLKALFLGRSTLMTHEEWQDEPVRRKDHEIRMYPSRFPTSLEWLCVDGGLLSIQEMVHYDRLAAEFRHYRPGGFNWEVVYRDIDVVFCGIGYAGGSARSIRENEHHKMDRFWRKPHD